ncbi:MAG TPA: hypothetical protein VFC63_19665 [Blastocatellia bacterium]|nr:hypothetical protein [Blastocatellia bacterium]
MLKHKRQTIIFILCTLALSVMASPFGVAGFAQTGRDAKSVKLPPAVANRMQASSQLITKFRAQSSVQWNQQVAGLKAIFDKYQPSLTQTQTKIAFNQTEFINEVHAINRITDLAKRQQQIQQLGAKYNGQLATLTKTAGIDPSVVRQQVSTVVHRPNPSSRLLETIVSGGDELQTAASPGPVVAERTLRPPYTTDGLIGVVDLVNGGRPGNSANPVTGILALHDQDESNRSIQQIAFISQDFNVQPGMHRIHVTASFDPISYFLSEIILIGYANNEAIANLHVMDGSNELCSQRFSLFRLSGVVSGINSRYESRTLSLSCDFIRQNADSGANYTVLGSIEGWAGSGGLFVTAQTDVTATVSYFQISQFER